MISPGFTFLSRNIRYPTEHLYIVISPIIDNKVLFVNVTTRKVSSDCSCTLGRGDHDFINHDSVINYGDALDAEVAKITEAIEQKIFKPHTPVSPVLLKKIQQGALSSPAFKPKFLKYLPSK